ncbi:hypothetical protein SAMN05216204_12135 [Massilia yuzhufengensis]|uniref:Uncharacterized protein n=1 Tax=Massilia yuzhufengensis TaxID=1164594 RepID=A0A1I1RBT1_9BURK|nr:hypothetical protein SAMN05216204_12135 [Massilia yuzhufengensis]
MALKSNAVYYCFDCRIDDFHQQNQQQDSDKKCFLKHWDRKHHGDNGGN